MNKTSSNFFITLLKPGRTKILVFIVLLFIYLTGRSVAYVSSDGPQTGVLLYNLSESIVELIFPLRGVLYVMMLIIWYPVFWVSSLLTSIATYYRAEYLYPYIRSIFVIVDLIYAYVLSILATRFRKKL